MLYRRDFIVFSWDSYETYTSTIPTTRKRSCAFHTNPQPGTPRAHTTGAPDTGNRTSSGSDRQNCNKRPAHSSCIATPATHTHTHTIKRSNSHKDITIQEDKTNIQPQPHNICSTHGPKSPNLTKLKILHLKACSACRTTRS